MMIDLDETGHPKHACSFETNAVHAARDPDQVTGAIVPSISLSTTFKMSSPTSSQSFVYSRTNNPTRETFEKALAVLENAKYGIAFASGSATISAALFLLEKGSHIISVDDVYGGTNRFLSEIAVPLGFEVTFIDMQDPVAVVAHLKSNTKMVWIESPTNPLMGLVDIKAVSKIVRSFSKSIIIVTDNTFLSPYFQTPLDLGSDLVIHSVTKYINGHADVIMGAAVTNSEDFYQRLKFLQNAIGAVPSPFDCFLALRGMQTLHLRMERAAHNALSIAQYLESLVPGFVERVLYPGLPSHRQYELAKHQQKGFGGMISFYIKGDQGKTSRFLQSLKIFVLAESLGGVESLAECPALMTHAAVSIQHREKLGITDNLVRLSVGIENANDLIQDLGQAIAAAQASSV